MEENSFAKEVSLSSKALITVIVPIYNVELFLSKCITSIIEQTYTNLQILLVNDGSTDNCGKICDEFATKDSRIRVLHKINEGQSSARNLGLEFAEGKYVNFIDSDDWIDAEFYSKILHHTEINHLDICVCSRKSFDENGLVGTLPVRDSKNIFYSIDHYVSDYFFKPFTPSCCNKLYLRKYIIENSITFEPVKTVGSEDTLFNFTFLLYVKKIGSVNDVYYNQFIRKGSTALTYSPGLMLRTKNLIAASHKILETNKKDNSSHRAAVAYMFLYFFNNNISKIKANFSGNQKNKVDDEFKLIYNDTAIHKFSYEIVTNKKLYTMLKRKHYNYSGIMLTKLIYFSIYLKNRNITSTLLKYVFKLN